MNVKSWLYLSNITISVWSNCLFVCVCLQTTRQTFRSNPWRRGNVGVEDKAKRTQSKWKWYHNTMWAQKTQSFPYNTVQRAAGEMTWHDILKVISCQTEIIVIQRLNIHHINVSHLLRRDPAIIESLVMQNQDDPPNWTYIKNMSVINPLLFLFLQITIMSTGTGKWVGEHCVYFDKETVFKGGHGFSVWEMWAWRSEISLFHQLHRSLCRGVRLDKAQEVRGDSSQSVPDNTKVPTIISTASDRKKNYTKC